MLSETVRSNAWERVLTLIDTIELNSLSSWAKPSLETQLSHKSTCTHKIMKTTPRFSLSNFVWVTIIYLKKCLTADHPRKNVRFADTIWWKVGAYASDIGSLEPSDTGPDRLVIAHSMFVSDNHGTLARNMTWVNVNNKNIHGLYWLASCQSH